MKVCMRSKTECKLCKSNIDGYCEYVEEYVDVIVKKWKSSQKSKAKRKMRENERFFTENLINRVIEQADIIRNSSLQSREQINAMNNMSAIFSSWKVVNTDRLFEED